MKTGNKKPHPDNGYRVLSSQRTHGWVPLEAVTKRGSPAFQQEWQDLSFWLPATETQHKILSEAERNFMERTLESQDEDAVRPEVSGTELETGVLYRTQKIIFWRVSCLCPSFWICLHFTSVAQWLCVLVHMAESGHCQKLPSYPVTVCFWLSVLVMNFPVEGPRVSLGLAHSNPFRQ